MEHHKAVLPNSARKGVSLEHLPSTSRPSEPIRPPHSQPKTNSSLVTVRQPQSAEPVRPEPRASHQPASSQGPAKANRVRDYLLNNLNLTPEEVDSSLTTSKGTVRFNPSVLDRRAHTPNRTLTSQNLAHMANAAADYSDFAGMTSRVAVLTVEKLKNVLKHYNAKYGSYHKLSGLKADLVARVRDLLAEAMLQNRAEVYQELVKVINNPTLCSSHSGRSVVTSPVAPTSTFQHDPVASSSTSTAQAAYSTPQLTANRFAAAPAASTLPRPIPVSFPSTGGSFNAPARIAGTVAPPNSGSISSKHINWKPNFFYSIVKALTEPISCPKALPGDRKSVIVNFTLDETDRTRIQQARGSIDKPQYQLRFFCTSDTYYNPPLSGYPAWRPNNYQNLGPAPVEFPAQSEIRVNGILLNVNLRGIKKKEGSTMPPDLCKLPNNATSPAINFTPNFHNRAELVYVNAPDKRHHVTVCLVLYIPPEKQVERILQRPSTPKDVTIQTILEANSDPDVVATSFALSLKCPLSFVRMTVPCKATACKHTQCFDALSFTSMVEQNPSFACPICNKTIAPDTLQVSSYIKELLQRVPSKYDSVVVELDATWHTDDWAYGTSAKPADWQPKVEVQKLEKPEAAVKSVEILDSDDDSVPRTSVPHLKANQRDSAMSFASPAPRSKSNSVQPRPSAVIDLTLSDSEEDVRPAATAPVINGTKRPREEDLDVARSYQRARLDL